MSDAITNYPHDPALSLGDRVRRPNPSPLWTGNTADRALAVPLPQGQDQAAEQVIISPPQAMSDSTVQSNLTILFREARIYDDRLQIARAQSFRLYNGEPMGDEEPGRSQIVLTEVKDSINAVMPTMMRTFAGANKPVEFLPMKDGAETEARQAQQYVQHVAFVENDGWRCLHDSMLDAFQLKAGWIHWFWDYSDEVRTEHYYALLHPQAQQLLSEPGVTAMKVVRRAATPQERAGIMASPESQVLALTPQTPILVYDAQITRKAPRNRPRIVACPSEQIIVDPDATGPHDPCLRFIGRYRVTTVSDLLALGMDRDQVMSRVTQLQQMQNRVTRRRDRLAAVIPRQQPPDKALWRVRYLECWFRMDLDGDGIAELHHGHAIGDGGLLLIAHEPASHVPLARICPFLVPYRAIGESFADRLGDVQRASTRVFRNILDSMSESIHPRTVILEGQVPVDDVLNTEMGAVIRERQPNAVRELAKPFIGPTAMPILETLQVIKESRTGITRTSQGLTADVLQSTTPIAVSAQIAASADRLELIVRTVAEGVRDLYQGLVRLLAEHQDRPRSVLLGGVWVPIDPRAWLATFNIAVKESVGAGAEAQRLQVLGQVAAQQKEIIQTLGPNNPLCGLGQLRNTLADMAECAGILNPARYFAPLPANFQYQPPAPPPAAEDVLAQAEAQKAAADAQTDRWRAETDRIEALLEDDRLRDEATVKALLEAMDLAGKYGTAPDLKSLAALLRRDPTSPTALRLAATLPPAITPAPPSPTAPASPAPTNPPALGAAIPPGNAPSSTRPLGLAQRMFLPAPLIAALAAANRSTPIAPAMVAARPQLAAGLM